MLKKSLKWLILVIAFWGVEIDIANAEKRNLGNGNHPNLVNIYFFHSNTCSHCQEEEKFLNQLENRYPNVKIYRYEVHDEKSKIAIDAVQKIYQLKLEGVPLTMIGNKSFRGYSAFKSKRDFILAIEYYSRYGYQDSLGEYLQIELLPFYKIKKGDLSMKEFEETYFQDTVLGIQVSSLDTSSMALLLGGLSGFNGVFLVSLVVVFLALRKVGGERNKTLLLGWYLFFSYLLLLGNVLDLTFLTLGIQIGTIALFTYALVQYYRNKKRQYVAMNAFILLAIIVSYVEFYWNNKYFLMFSQMNHFYQFISWDKVSYYGTYFVVIAILYLMFFLLCSAIGKKLRRL